MPRHGTLPVSRSNSQTRPVAVGTAPEENLWDFDHWITGASFLSRGSPDQIQEPGADPVLQRLLVGTSSFLGCIINRVLEASTCDLPLPSIPR